MIATGEGEGYFGNIIKGIKKKVKGEGYELGGPCVSLCISF